MKHLFFAAALSLGAGIPVVSPMAFAEAGIELRGVQTLSALEGLYQFSGQHATRGAYKGELELRMSKDNQLVATKKITYETFKYEGLTVEEIWTGTAQLNDTTIELQFALRQADYLARVDEEKRTDKQFQNKLEFTQRLHMNREHTLTSMLNAGAEGNFSEVYTEMSALPEAPIWQDLRHRNSAVGDTLSSLERIGYHFKFDPIIKWFRAQPEVVALSKTKDFQDHQQYMVIDTTDFNFYQEHRDVLRVPNKVVDRLSLIEEMSRRNAYAYTKDEKAKIFDERMAKLNINEYGLVTPSEMDADHHFTKFGMDQDSALWTGMYVASQGMRYEVTKDLRALENIKRCVDGLFLLMDLPTEKGEFARYVMDFDPSIKVAHDGIKFEWRETTLPTGQHVNWMFGGNNDMYKGMVTAFTWADLVIPETDTAFHAKLESYVRRLPSLNIAQSSKDNKRYASGVVALVLHDAKAAEDYLKNAESLIEKLGQVVGVDKGMYSGGMADWSGINLAMVSNVADVTLAKALAQAFPNLARKMNDAAAISQKDLMKQAEAYAPIRRDALNVAAYAMAFKDQAALLRYSNDTIQGWNRFFTGALFKLNEMPIDQLPNDVDVDRSKNPEWSLSAYPSEPWKSVKTKQPVSYHMQSVESYPLFEMNAYYTTFVWKDSAFDISCNNCKTRQVLPRTDYLYMYWMARWSGLLAE